MTAHQPKNLLRTPMSDRAAYNAELARSVGSKLFFLDKVPMAEIEEVVDFGCADATLLRTLHRAFPSPLYVGVDRDPEQLAAARSTFPSLLTLPRLPHRVPDRPGKRLLILSSVMHEVWSEGTTGDHQRFWEEVEACGFDFIAVRDFGLPGWTYLHTTPIEVCDQIYGRIVFGSGESWNMHDLLAQFERRFGPVRDRFASAIHFLLKAPYPENWSREMEENYVRYPREQMVDAMTTSGCYRVRHVDYTSTPRFRGQLGMLAGLPHTHVELVLERRA